jgi:beta-glucanase (GH16 family)
MITTKLFISALVLLFFILPITAAPGNGWKLLWSDEFAGPAKSPPDPSKWRYDLGADGWGNHELEEYTDSTANVTMDGHGHLLVRAIRSGQGKYTSGRLKTQGRFEVQYGKIEARIRVPFGQGIWPAFWMLGSNISEVGWPNCGEIDIMENIGKEPSIIHGTVHGPGYSGGQGISAQTSLGGKKAFSSRFHIFAVEWSPESIMFSLDRVTYAKVTRESLRAGERWVFDKPFFLLINLAVGGDWPGNPDPATRFPQTLVVDWVRVWRAANHDRALCGSAPFSKSGEVPNQKCGSAGGGWFVNSVLSPEGL